MSSFLIVLADYRVITWLIQSTDSATLHRRRYYLLSPQLSRLPTYGISPAGPAWRSCSPRSPARPGSRGQSRGPGHGDTQCDVTRSTPPDLCHQRPPESPWQASLPPSLCPAHIISSWMRTVMPAAACHCSHTALPTVTTCAVCSTWGRGEELAAIEVLLQLRHLGPGEEGGVGGAPARHPGHLPGRSGGAWLRQTHRLRSGGK